MSEQGKPAPGRYRIWLLGALIGLVLPLAFFFVIASNEVIALSLGWASEEPRLIVRGAIFIGAASLTGLLFIAGGALWAGLVEPWIKASQMFSEEGWHVIWPILYVLMGGAFVAFGTALFVSGYTAVSITLGLIAILFGAIGLVMAAREPRWWRRAVKLEVTGEGVRE
jgi:hypothetical protein